MSIFNIQPIKLLKGSHEDTGETGQGCAMNVIAYLNGEDQITDRSPCVCLSMRKIVVWFNDFLRDNERELLVPYLLRIMGTATDDPEVMEARRVHVRKFAEDMETFAANAAYVPGHTSSFAGAARAAYVAGVCAIHAVDADAARTKIIQRTLEFFEAVCPPLEPCAPEVLERAEKLVKLNVKAVA